VLIIAVITAAMVGVAMMVTMMTVIINENTKGGKESTVVAATH
jgi:hypothetical protein